jgi:exonuclease SbcD
MRILHFSDVHIGVENYGRTDPDTGLSTRLIDFLGTLDEVVDYALDTRVDLVLFCGDAYKSRDPSQTHQREFARRIARLSSGNIPVFLLVGNHDMPFTAGRATSLEIFRTLDVSNVYTGDTVNTHVISTASGPVQVVALPWIRRSVFLTREDTQGLTPEGINEAIQAALTRIIREKAEALDPALPAILAGHVSVSDAKTSSEQSMMLGRDHVLLRSNVALPQFDHVALGHIHRHQVIGQDPKTVYAGSLQRIDFGEENDDKGFCVIELDPAMPTGQRFTGEDFHLVDARRFLTVSVDIPRGDLDPTATVVQAIEGTYFDDAIVRVIIKVSAEMEGHLRDADIRSALGEAHHVASISREVVEQARNRLGNARPQTLEPREALRLYMASRDVPADRAEVLLRHADDLMEDEDLS